MTCPESQELFVAAHHFYDEVLAMAQVVKVEKEKRGGIVKDTAVDIALDTINVTRYH